MKITLICQEIPYPAIHGSRIDMWRRIKAFADRGVELQAIFWWFGTAPTPTELAEIQKYVPEVLPIQIEQTWAARLRRGYDLLSYPLETTSRMIKGQNLIKTIDAVRKFNPDVVFLDGIHGGVIATKLSQMLDLPILTRSHNIEHLYARRMLQSAIGTKDKFRRYLATINLEKYERSILSNSAFFYDISADDLKFWHDRGFANGHLLPPLIEFPDRFEPKDPLIKSYDLVFLGNLNSENNVAGLIWFLTEVFPLIRDRLPKTTVLIAGFNPVDRIRQICDRIDGVELSVNPQSASNTYRSGKVLINPILTGSGVKIKSIEMLTTGLPIVSTVEGVSGLPDAVKPYFKIADNARDFATAAIEFLSIDFDLPTADRGLLETYFGNQIVEHVINDIESIVRN
jgi:polysaccharide biosynthesis protein PslH